MTSGAMQTLTKNNNSTSISSKVPDEAVEDGIYYNSRASYVAASLIGCPVRVQVKDGTIYDGILSTISPELTIVLDMAHKCGDSTKVSLQLTKETPIIDTIAFTWPDVVAMTAPNVDLGYAVREFATDTAISGRANGQPAVFRDLEPFQLDGPLVGGLEDGGRQNGWSADEMFKTNESKFTVQSSFNQDLSQYTTPLPSQSSADYREKSERAARLAMEIECGDVSRDRVDLENGGDDEEMAFSAVHRNQRPSRNNHHSNAPQSSYRRGGGGGDRGMGMNGPRPVGRGGPSGRGGSAGPSPRQFGSPQQQGPGATSPQTPMGSTSPVGGAGGLMSQQPPRPGGGVGRQDSNSDNRYHHQPPPQHGGRMQTSDYGRQASAPDNWRNHGLASSSVEPRHAGNRNEVRPAAVAGGPGRSPQPTAANEPRRSVGASSSAEKSREPSGPVDGSKLPPWGSNQQSPSQQQPPRNEPIPLRSQAPPLSSAGRPLTSEQQKPLQLKGPKETQRIADLQEFSEQFKIQYEPSQAVRDSKSSPHSGPSPHPSPLRLEQGGGADSGHDLHPRQGLKASVSEPLNVKSAGDVPLHHALPTSTTVMKAGEEGRASGDKVAHVADGELAADAEKKKQIVKGSTLNPNAKEFNPAKMFQPKPPPTPPRVAPLAMAPPVPAAAAPQPAAPAQQILLPAGATLIPMQSYPVMMSGGPAGQMVRPVQQTAATKRATVSVATSRLEQAQAATGQPLVATQSAGYNIIPYPQVRLLDPSQMTPQQQQQMIGVTQQMAQHMANQQHQHQQRPMGAAQGGHSSSSPVHQPPMQAATSSAPPTQVYYSQQQQMMGTPASPQQTYSGQPHYTTLQQQFSHVALQAGYQYGPAQQHSGAQPTGQAPHGFVQMGGGYMQHAPTHLIVQQQPPQQAGQPHPASQMQPLVGQGHPGIPGGVSNQPAGLPPQYVTAQPMSNVYYQVPSYIAAQPGTAYHPAGGHMVPSSMQTYQSTQ